MGISALISAHHTLNWWCCFSVAQWFLTHCNPLDCSTPGFPVLHHLPEVAQTHVHWVGDAIQPSRPLASPSPPAFNLSQHQGFFPMSQLFTSGGWSIGTSASVLPMNIHGWFLLGLTVGSPCSPRESQESSPTPQFENMNSSVLSLLSHPYTYWKNHNFD